MEIKIDFFNKIHFKHIIFAGTFLLGTNLYAQTLLTEAEVENLALANSPMLNSSTLQIQQQRQLQGASYNIPNPSILIESPTGEFMTVGIVQSFEFPTVYSRQHQLSKQRTLLSEKYKVITAAEIKREVRMAYLDHQYAQALLIHFQRVDSLYFSLKDASERQFNAGQIDYVSKALTLVQYAEVHNRYIEAQNQLMTSTALLQLHTGITDRIETTFLSKKEDPSFFPDSISGTPLQAYYKQQEVIAQKELELQKTKALPGFSIGYMNQSSRDTPIPLRLQAGINVPIWFKQYKSSTQAAKTNVDIAQQNLLANQRAINTQLSQARGEIQRLQSSLNYYEQTGLGQTDELITASRRLFAAGETDYPTFLRTLSDTYNIRLRYLESLRIFNQAVINMQYLMGQ